jgi:hypothetical protein
MTDKPNYTGVCPPEFFSTGGSQWSSPDAAPAPASKKELIEVWFIEPLRRMDGHQAFVCLSVCLFLYEKYLKKTGQIGKDEKFSEGHKVFKQMGKDLGISADDAYEFWSCWRNGLAHQGMPKISDKYHWGMTGEQKELVIIDGDTFTINPWLIRDKILNKVENKKEIWNDEFAPLMKVFRITKP